MSYLALIDDDTAKYAAGDVVRHRSNKQELTVVSHREGTVRVQWESGGNTMEVNYSACELVLIRRGVVE